MPQRSKPLLERRRVTLRGAIRQELRGFAARTFASNAPYRGFDAFLRGLGDVGTGILSPAEIQQVAANAGFTGADLATAVAIALAESVPSGKANSYNPERQKATPEGKGSYGLWQIYLLKHPEFSGQNLFDPQTNANAAFRVYQAAGGNFSPWSTFGNGVYRSYLRLVPAVAPAEAAAAPAPPLTIDAGTSLPINDTTATPLLTAGVTSKSPGQILGLTLLGVGAYLAADWFFGD